MERRFSPDTRATAIAFAIIMLFAMVLFSGCSISGISSPPDDLTRPEWHLIQYLGSDGNRIGIIPGTFITLKFDNNGTLSGSAGCNRYSGSYSVEGELITIQSVAATERYCSGIPGLMEQERHFLSLLPESTRYTINDQYLVLAYYDEEKYLIFIRD